MSIFLAVANFAYSIFALMAALKEPIDDTTSGRIAWVCTVLLFLFNAMYMVIMS